MIMTMMTPLQVLGNCGDGCVFLYFHFYVDNGAVLFFFFTSMRFIHLIVQPPIKRYLAYFHLHPAYTSFVLHILAKRLFIL